MLFFCLVSIILLHNSSSFFINSNYNSNIDKVAKRLTNFIKDAIPSCNKIEKCMESADNLITKNQIETLKERIKRVMFCDNENSQDDAGCFGYAYFIRKPKKLVNA